MKSLGYNIHYKYTIDYGSKYNNTLVKDNIVLSNIFNRLSNYLTLNKRIVE